MLAAQEAHHGRSTVQSDDGQPRLLDLGGGDIERRSLQPNPGGGTGGMVRIAVGCEADILRAYGAKYAARQALQIEVIVERSIIVFRSVLEFRYCGRRVRFRTKYISSCLDCTRSAPQSSRDRSH